jgi:large subunit ribosomal protein L13
MSTKTYRLSGKQMDRSWHVLDAANRPLGRIASDAARLLLGKHKPDYEPFLPMGDFVVIVNAGAVAVTGAKTKRKVYYRHTGYPGGLRERTLEEQMERDPTKVLERAVKGMLPHNSHGRELFRHLKVYVGADHPHEAQVNAGTGARVRKRERQAEAAAVETAVAAVPAAEAPPAETPVAVAPAVEAPAEAAAVAEVPVVAEAPAEAAAADAARLTGSLSRYKRDELDEEATRLEIAIDADWNKPDVADAIQAHYDAHPVPADEDE